MAADVSAFTYFAPLLSFLIVFTITAVLLYRTKVLGESSWLVVFVSFLISVVFVTAASVRQVVLDVIPWFVVLLLALFFMMMLIKFVGTKTDDVFGKHVGWIFVVAVIVLFLVAGIKVFAAVFYPYLPGPYFGQGGDPQLTYFFSWIYSPQIFGAILLLLVGGAVSWFLARNLK